MREWKQLLSINLCLVLLLCLVSPGAAAAAIPGDAAAVLVIDGCTYPAEQDASGTGWAYHALDHSLELRGYSGGSISLPEEIAFTLSACGGSVVNGSLALGTYTRIDVPDQDTFTLNCPVGTAVRGRNCRIHTGEGSRMIINGSPDAAAISVMYLWLDGSGSASIHTSFSTGVQVMALYAEDRIRLELTAARNALEGKLVTAQLSTDMGIFLTPDSQKPVSKYEHGSYLRIDRDLHPVILHANGGRWTNQGGEEKCIYIGSRDQVSLGKYSELLTNPGNILVGWCDETDSREYGVNDWAEFPEALTLYAKWERETLRIDGKDYPVNCGASGSGWSFTPGSGSMAARLILNHYQGGPIYTTGDLMVQSSGTVTVTGRTGVPAVQTRGDLTFRIDSGSVALTGGLGENAVRVGGTLELYNWGEVNIRGGEGGEAIYARDASVIENAGQIAAVGGSLSNGLSFGDALALRGGGESIFLSGGRCQCAVSCGNLILDEALKIYAGDNASDAHRVELCGKNSYVRIVPRTVQVKLVANGGRLGNETSVSKEYDYPEDGIITLQSEQEPVRPGYQFTGWNTSADGSGRSYAMGQTFSPAEEGESLVLFAQWTDKECHRSFSGGQMQLKLNTGLSGVDQAVYAVYNSKSGKLLRVAVGTPVNPGEAFTHEWTFPVSAAAEGVERVFFLAENGSPLRGEILLPEE